MRWSSWGHGWHLGLSSERGRGPWRIWSQPLSPQLTFARLRFCTSMLRDTWCKAASFPSVKLFLSAPQTPLCEPLLPLLQAGTLFSAVFVQPEPQCLVQRRQCLVKLFDQTNFLAPAPPLFPRSLIASCALVLFSSFIFPSIENECNYKYRQAHLNSTETLTVGKMKYTHTCLCLFIFFFFNLHQGDLGSDLPC